jgi:hypothetical protein
MRFMLLDFTGRLSLFRDGHHKTTEGEAFIINSDNKDVICDWNSLFVVVIVNKGV